MLRPESQSYYNTPKSKKSIQDMIESARLFIEALLFVPLSHTKKVDGFIINLLQKKISNYGYSLGKF